MRTDTIAGSVLPESPPIREQHWRAAAAALSQVSTDPWGDGWRLNGPPRRWIRHGDQQRAVPPGRAADAPSVARDGEIVHVDVDGQSLEFSLAPPPTIEEAVRHATAAGDDGTATLLAPMPGRVIGVRVAEGERVRAHQPIVVIEAMKMEHAVVAPIGGMVASLVVREGQQVERGEVLGDVSPYHGDDG